MVNATKPTQSERWKAPTGRLNKIRLDLSEGFPISQVLEGMLQHDLLSQISIYPEYDELLALVAEDNHIGVPQIAITNGADQAIEIFFRMVPPSARVIMITPIFSYYRHCADIQGIEVIPLAYSSTTKLPLKEVAKHFREGDYLVLCSPNNPLGCSTNQADFDQLHQLVTSRRGTIVVDECYREYATTPLRLTPDDTNIVVRSFSKFYGLAGLRLGYVISGTSTIEEILTHRGPWDVNAIAVAAGIECLKNTHLFQRAANLLRERKLFFESQLSFLGFWTTPTETNFSLVQNVEVQKFVDAARNLDVLVCSLEDYPDSFGLLNNSIRIGVPQQADISKVLDVFKQLTKYILPAPPGSPRHTPLSRSL